MAETDDDGVARLAALCSRMGRLWPERRIDVWTDAPPAATVEDCKLSLIGKVLSNPPINLQAFQSTLRRVWRIDHVEISVREEGLYVAKFKFAADRQRVLDGGPWLFSGHLVIFKAWIPDTPLQCYSFLTCPFWVHILGIPIEWCSENMITRAVRNIGRVLEVRTDSKEGTPIRIAKARVDLDVREPLKT